MPTPPRDIQEESDDDETEMEMDELSDQDDDSDYDVEAITGVRTEVREGGARRQFRVKFAGYTEQEWVDEKNCRGIQEMIKAYLVDKPEQPPIKLVPIAGAISRPGVRVNSNNWMTFNGIMEKIQAYARNKRYYGRIGVEIYEGQEIEGERILLVPMQSHCAALKNEGVAYVADGANLVSDYEEARREVEEKLGLKIKSMRFAQQTHVDYCGS